MSGLNLQNSLGNIYLPGINNAFLKKKIGKNKYSISKILSSPLAFEDNLILSDDKGTIYNINLSGKINWKVNIYKKIYKKIYKNLIFSIYKNNIYIADNIGFIYAIDLYDGKLLWLKNHGIPLRSNIKTFKNKLFVINQDNRLLCLNTKDGTKIWDIRSITSFIKLQNLLSLAVTKQKDLLAINSAGDLIKTNPNNGFVYWSVNATSSLYAHATDFLKISEIVVTDDAVIFSTGTSIFSYNLNDSSINWEKNVASVAAPIVDGKNIFFSTSNGFFVIMDIDTGKIISSNYILKTLKKKKQETKVTGFIMGSGKIYSVTLNGYLIVSSAMTGKVEFSKKIGGSISTNPIINNGRLYILNEQSQIYGFN